MHVVKMFCAEHPVWTDIGQHITIGQAPTRGFNCENEPGGGQQLGPAAKRFSCILEVPDGLSGLSYLNFIELKQGRGSCIQYSMKQ